MDSPYFSFKVSTERLKWKRIDIGLCMDWNGYMDVFSDKDQIWNDLDTNHVVICKQFWIYNIGYIPNKR